MPDYSKNNSKLIKIYLHKMHSVPCIRQAVLSVYPISPEFLIR